MVFCILIIENCVVQKNDVLVSSYQFTQPWLFELVEKIEHICENHINAVIEQNNIYQNGTNNELR